jgi:DNA transposition AAA+ family ATPase
MRGGREVVGEMVRVAGLVEAGEILAPGNRQEAVVLSDDTQKQIARVARHGAFYETATVRRVAEVCNYCAEQAAIGLVTGAYGVGKSEAVRHWRGTTAGKVDSLLFEFSEFTGADKVGFVGALGRIFGAEKTTGHQNGCAIFEDLCERLRERPTLLIFDQGECARPRIHQIVRQLHDRTAVAGVGVVILAAPILLARLNKMPDLGALASRVGIFAPLSGLGKSEMAAIVKQEGLTDIDDAAFDLWFRQTGGSMRRLMRAIALMQAKHAGKRITERTVAGVASHLWADVGRAA